MNALVIDLTHGGLIIAMELAKSGHFNETWAWDIYQTTTPKQKSILHKEGIKLINNQLKEIKDFVEIDDLKLFISSSNPDFNINSDLKLISPVHCPLDIKPDFTHHQVINLLLKDFKKSGNNNNNQPEEFLSLNLSEEAIKNLIIEVTGVKGKTSSMGMLKKIFAPYRPLILSSLGAEIFEDSELKKESIILQKNISITPASIIETVKLAENYDYGPCIFETSLGTTGMADVGLITNVVEDYSIAQNKSKASIAKEQIFQSKMVCCEYDTFFEHYSHLKDNLKDKINLFSFDYSTKSNLYIPNIKYGLKNSFIEIRAHNLKTTHGKVLNCEFSIETFAPSPYQVQNVLAAVCCALTAGLSPPIIKKGMENFFGLEGRSSLKIMGETIIIEEINPGINVSAIENAINMVINQEKSMVILGGQYGITCEEIDEFKTAKLLEKLFYNAENSVNPKKEPVLILTHELGKGIKNKMKSDVDYVFDPQEALNLAIKNGAKNVIFIYRSNYANIELR